MDTGIVLTRGRFWAIDITFAEHALELIAAITPAEAITLQAEFEARQRERDARRAERVYTVRDGVAVIPMKGVLTKAESCAGSLFGGETVTPLITQMVRDSAKDPDVKSRVMDVDSPGGDVSGIAELARAVTETAQVKPIYAAVNELAASAAMWGISGATKIIGPKTSQAGNVGVYTVLRDTSRATSNAGVNVHLVGSSHLKGIGERGVPITAEQLSYMRERVGNLAEEFYQDLQANRRLTDDQLAEIKLAKSYIAHQAVQHGLMDGIGNLDDVVKQASQGSVHYSIPGGGIKMRLGDLGKMLGITPTEEERPLADQQLPLTAVLSAEEAATVTWLREKGLAGASGLQRLTALVEAQDSALIAARERASKLAVAVFDKDQDAIKAAEEFLSTASLDMVQATVVSYEATLKKLGLASDNGERMTAAKPAEGDDDRTRTAGDPNNGATNLAERVAAMEQELRQMHMG